MIAAMEGCQDKEFRNTPMRLQCRNPAVVDITGAVQVLAANACQGGNHPKRQGPATSWQTEDFQFLITSAKAGKRVIDYASY
jgi:hypothetical protein